jgi:hypothetical protein
MDRLPLVGVGLVVLVWQFPVQVAATLVGLFLWDRMRGRRAR